jgi:hypothetical protein
MGEIIRFDKFAMDAIAECLENAASDILLTEINWPEQQDDTATTAIDLQVESARLWTEASSIGWRSAPSAPGGSPRRWSARPPAG